MIFTTSRGDSLERQAGSGGILSSQIRSRFAPGYNIELTGVDLRRFDPDDPF